MSKLEELIKEFCPNGVEYKPLWSLTAWDKRFNGIDRSMQKKVVSYKYYLSSEFNEVERKDGDILYIPTGITNEKRYTTEELAGEYLAEGEIVCIPWGGTPNVKYHKGKFVTGDNRIATSLDTNILDNKYLYYWMQSKIDLIASFYRGAGIQHPSMKSVLELQIPLPALPVQREIVRILDSFTLYSAELTAELTARRKQYEFYRDKLLKFDSGNIPRVKLKDIATEFYRGYGITREQVTKEGIPCVRYGEIYTTYNTWFDKCVSYTKVEDIASPKYFEYGDILFAITGESVEDIAKSAAYIGNEKCLAGGDIVVMKHKQNPKFLAYALSTFDARQQKSKGKIKSKVVHSNVPSIENIEIYLPPIDVQERIVKVLDNFDAICSDLGIGLPAEIEKRQKQYEYYREKLLTFDGKYATILTERNGTERNGQG